MKCAIVLLILLLFRELIKVGQRNFRKYMSMREWGWFIIIQKTRPLIGRSVTLYVQKVHLWRFMVIM